MLIGEKRIVTPTKCGTHSIEAMLMPLGYEVELPRHKADPADYMMIRHPYDRLVSGWWYIQRRRAWPNMTGYTFDDYVRKLLVNRTIEPVWRVPFIWSNTLTDYASFCGATKFIRVEHMVEDLQALGFDVQERRLNTADNNPCPRVSLSVGMQEVVYEWCKQDLALGGYQYEDRSL